MVRISTSAASTAPAVGTGVGIGSVRTAATSHTVSVPALFWGAAVGPQLTGEQAPWSQPAVTDFEKEVGRKPSIQPIGWTMGQCSAGKCAPVDLPAAGLTLIRQDGAIPMVNFSTDSFQGGKYDKNFSTTILAKGTLDTWIRQEAQQVKAWKYPMFIRMDWEMNGTWFPWSAGQYGDTAASYVAAWRHIWTIFHNAGVRNVTWVWCPNIGTEADGLVANTASFYPGSKYVDWTCMDVYNQAGIDGNPFQTFSQLATPSYDAITQTIAPNKPMMIGEFASDTVGGSKGDWIADAFKVVRKDFPRIRAMVYWDRDDGGDGVNWNIEGNSGAVSGFHTGVSSVAYVNNAYANLGTLHGAIQPPTLHLKR